MIYPVINPPNLTVSITHIGTVSGERFAGLNILLRIPPNKVFMGNFRSALRLKHLSNVII